MRPENEARLARIKKISGILRWMCKAFLGLCVLGLPVTVWVLLISRSPVPDCGHCISYERHLFLSYNGVQLDLYDITDRGRVAVGILFASILGVMFNCGYQLHRLLDNYSRGEVFTSESAGRIRKWGIACVLWGVMGILWAFVPRLVLVHSPNTIQAEGGAMILSGLTIVAISWFMDMAAEMREENELTV